MRPDFDFIYTVLMDIPQCYLKFFHLYPFSLVIYLYHILLFKLFIIYIS